MTPEELDNIPAVTKQHIDNVTEAQNALSRNQPHHKSPEGKIFNVVLEVLSFVLNLLHAGHSGAAAPPEATATATAVTDQTKTDEQKTA